MSRNWTERHIIELIRRHAKGGGTLPPEGFIGSSYPLVVMNENNTIPYPQGYSYNRISLERYSYDPAIISIERDIMPLFEYEEAYPQPNTVTIANWTQQGGYVIKQKIFRFDVRRTGTAEDRMSFFTLNIPRKYEEFTAAGGTTPNKFYNYKEPIVPKFMTEDLGWGEPMKEPGAAEFTLPIGCFGWNGDSQEREHIYGKQTLGPFVFRMYGEPNRYGTLPSTTNFNTYSRPFFQIGQQYDWFNPDEEEETTPPTGTYTFVIITTEVEPYYDRDEFYVEPIVLPTACRIYLYTGSRQWGMSDFNNNKEFFEELRDAGIDIYKGEQYPPIEEDEEENNDTGDEDNGNE